MIEIAVISSFLLDIFKSDIFKNVASDRISHIIDNKLNKSEIEQAKEALKDSDKKFLKLITTIISNNKSLEKKLEQLYEQSKGDINYFINGNQVNFNNSNVIINAKDDYINYYNKGIEEINRGDYFKAIENLEEFSQIQSKDFFNKYSKITDSELLIIASKLCTDYISNLILKENNIDEYIQIINNKYNNNYLGLVILGIIYCEYFKNEPKELGKVEKKLKLIEKDVTYAYIVKVLNCEDKTRRRLGLQESFEESFKVSEESAKVEDYRCYYNTANNNFIDGLELKHLDKESKKRWYFFYKPSKQYIGTYQKNIIKGLNATIRTKKEELKKLLLYSNCISWGSIFISLLLVKFDYLLIALGITLTIAFYIFKNIKKIDLLENSIDNSHIINKELKSEIGRLYKQLLTDIPTIEEMEYEFYKDLSGFKNDFIKILKESKTNINEKNQYTFKEWAFLQPSSNKEKFGFEKTGIKNITDDIKYKISTLAKKGGVNINPFYRVWYIQFIYILDNNVITYGLFYDFITKKQYGNKSESFQYNHISNLSISEIKLKENDVYNRMNISNKLIKEIYRKNFHLISFGVSSGKSLHFIIEEKNMDKNIKNPLESAYSILDKIKKRVNKTQNHTETTPSKEKNTIYYFSKSNTPNYH